MSALMDSLLIRPFEDTDHGFVFSTFFKGVYSGNSWFHEMSWETYKKNYSPVIQKLIEYSKPQIKIACLREDPDVILGYVILEGKRLHYIHVKARFQRYGIAKALVGNPTEIEEVSHLTTLGKKLKPRYWDFNPFF